MKKVSFGREMAEPKPKQIYVRLTDEQRAELNAALEYYSLNPPTFLSNAVKAIVAAHKKQANLVTPLRWTEGIPMPNIVSAQQVAELLNPPPPQEGDPK